MSLLQIRRAQLESTSDDITERGPGILSMNGQGRATVVGSSASIACVQFRYLGLSDELRESGGGLYLHQIGLMIRHENESNVIYLTWRMLPAPELLLQVKRLPRIDPSCHANGYCVIKRQEYPAFGIGEFHQLLTEVQATGDGGAIATVWVDWQQVMREPIAAVYLTDLGPDNRPGFRSDNGRYDFQYFVDPG